MLSSTFTTSQEYNPHRDQCINVIPAAQLGLQMNECLLGGRIISILRQQGLPSAEALNSLSGPVGIDHGRLVVLGELALEPVPAL